MAHCPHWRGLLMFLILTNALHPLMKDEDAIIKGLRGDITQL